MAGFSSVTGDESIMFADNCSFDGTQRNGKLNTDGQLFIGSTDSPHIKKGSLTSPLGTVNIGYSSPNITLDVANGVGPPQTPLRTISDFDDFLTTSPPTNPSPKLGFIGLSATWRPFAGTASNPGIIVNNLVELDQSDAVVLDSDPASTASFLLGSCELTSNWVCNLGTLSDVTNRYISYIGISDSSYIDLNNNGVSIPLNGCFFQYSDNVNSGNWQIVCGKAGSYTTVNTSTPAATGFHNYGIHVNSTATIATFTIDGVTVGTTITTNIPDVIPVGPSILIENVSGTLLPFYVDLYYYLQVLNTARPGTQTVWPGTMGITSVTGDSGGSVTPTANNINVLGLSGSKTAGLGSTLTVKSPPFLQIGTGSTSVLNTGEFVTAAVTRTLPASAGLADGDLFMFVCTTAGALVIQSVTAQKIRIGNVISAAAGTATSTAIGDSLTLRFNATDGFFYAVSVVGTWLVV